MGLLSTIGTIVKGKVLITTVASVALLGTAGVAFAATTPAGQNMVQNLTGVHATMTPTHEADNDNKGTPGAHDKDNKGNSNCPGQPEAQKLATEFSLSTDSKGNSMQLICTLHDGTFKGTVDGQSVTVDHALGYGEIEQLLTAAQSLAKKDNTKLTDDNVLTFVATALKNCGSTPVGACVNATAPANQSDNGHGTNGAKPTVTPHADGKPTSTPTSHH